MESADIRRWIILVRFTMNGPLLRHFLSVNSGRPRISFVRSPARVLKADLSKMPVG